MCYTSYDYFSHWDGKPGARYYDPVLGIWKSVDPLDSERTGLSPYNYVQNNPLGRIDPTGALDTRYEDEDGNPLAETNDGNNATVVVTNDKKDAFLDEYNNTSVMLKDGESKNAEWIQKYGIGLVASEGANVQGWAVAALGHDANYNCVVVSTSSFGMEVLKREYGDATFRIFNKKSTNFSPRIYTSGWGGGSVGQIKTYGLGKVLGVAGSVLGWYSVGATGLDIMQGRTNSVQGVADIIMGVGAIFGGAYGAAAALGWEVGKHWGPSKWYGKDNTKWFK